MNHVFKKLQPRCVTTLPLGEVEIEFVCKVDEIWSFVGNKKCQPYLGWDIVLKKAPYSRSLFLHIMYCSKIFLKTEYHHRNPLVAHYSVAQETETVPDEMERRR